MADQQETRAQERATPASTTLEVRNSQADKPRAVLFGRLPGGRFEARLMAEDEVPYTPCWPDELEQAMVYIEPDEAQLARMLSALRDGRLQFSQLQEFGGLDGGTSSIPA